MVHFGICETLHVTAGRLKSLVVVATVQRRSSSAGPNGPWSAKQRTTSGLQGMSLSDETPSPAEGALKVL